MVNTSIFTKIINREIPAKIRFEDEDFIVFDDIHPAAPVHVLVVPKKTYQSLEKIPVEDMDYQARLLMTVRIAADLMGIADNYKIHVNVGEKVQAVQHLHIHVMGGWGKKMKQDEIEESIADFINSTVA